MIRYNKNAGVRVRQLRLSPSKAIERLKTALHKRRPQDRDLVGGGEIHRSANGASPGTTIRVTGRKSPTLVAQYVGPKRECVNLGQDKERRDEYS